jgi:hypothetical protein
MMSLITASWNELRASVLAILIRSQNARQISDLSSPEKVTAGLMPGTV